MTAESTVSDYLRFLRSWASDPLRVSAVAPSGGSLARLITREISASDKVLELGAGTGSFTKALIARGVREEDLTLVESGSEFARLLQRRYPGARVLGIDATRLDTADLYPEGTLDAVVSGLPLLSMPPHAIAAILSGAFSYVRPGGRFYQFTYGPRCPVPRPVLERLGLEATRIGRTIRNLPPAAVYRITRPPTAGAREV